MREDSESFGIEDLLELDFGADGGVAGVGEGEEPGVGFFWGSGGGDGVAVGETDAASEGSEGEGGGDGGPVALGARACVGGVVEFGFCEAAVVEGAGEFDGVAFDDGFAGDGEGFAF